MKKIAALLVLFSVFSVTAQDKKETKKSQIVEASCGQCQFKMEGHGCDLAVRIDGKNYFVDGTSLDSHGDAHAEDGFCSAIRKAEVTGEVVDNRFKATSFKLLPEKQNKTTK
ncbi:DUF6370 family protein [Flavobacterium sp. K5-23]|uniref:DUF6370 family protein n=1 Tax=Flavobacterium sp. K5-23 TaxID=2746225 RepID=UPI00200EEB7F|nr:DUF6370 family protein [Flavobacterium sp. K5-23]UQD55103.1 hypothetical protein FLAK523_01345 [Flavobacterium sp. K5-23]